MLLQPTPSPLLPVYPRNATGYEWTGLTTRSRVLTRPVGLQLVTRGVFNAPSDLRHMNLGSERGTPCPTVTFTSRLKKICSRKRSDTSRARKKEKKEGRSLGQRWPLPSIMHWVGQKVRVFPWDGTKTRTYCLDSPICMWPGFLQPHPILSPAVLWLGNHSDPTVISTDT